MNILELILQNIWAPNLLSIPSPSLPVPANWLIPPILWLAILHGVISLIRGQNLAWLWTKIYQSVVWFGTRLSEALAFPEPRPMGNIIAEFGAAITHLAFAIYFLVYGLTVVLMGVVHLRDKPLPAILLIVVGFCVALAGRYYLVQFFKAKRKLLTFWTQYPKSKTWALTSLAGFTAALCITIWVMLEVVPQ
ncbi:hypothetical protein GALL_203650 [mine drainage metagenome]|uniref:Uncharacterized protein n=1 Tax=mine drainage metagenome TaxID=410659 RepID=A0A1J5RNI0_9ZZZZ